MAGTLTASIIKNDTTSPTQFQNSAGTEIGTLCRSWVNFNAVGTVTIRASFNVSSITDNGVGLFTINFTNAMPDANYSPVMCWRRNNGTVGENNVNGGISARGNATYATAFTTSALQITTSTVTSEALTDYDFCSVAIFR